jgi:hypothetical protein
MSYQAKFTGCQNLTLEDLVVAYRKAKADCFFENTFPTAIKSAEYEQDLLANLKALLSSLQSKNGFAENTGYLGEFRLLPNKLSFFLVPTRCVEPRCCRDSARKPTARGNE